MHTLTDLPADKPAAYAELEEESARAARGRA